MEPSPPPAKINRVHDCRFAHKYWEGTLQHEVRAYELHVVSTHLFSPSLLAMFLVLLTVFLAVLLLVRGSLVSLIWRGRLTAMPLVVLLSLLQLRSNLCAYHESKAQCTARVPVNISQKHSLRCVWRMWFMKAIQYF